MSFLRLNCFILSAHVLLIEELSLDLNVVLWVEGLCRTVYLLDYRHSFLVCDAELAPQLLLKDLD